MEVIFTGWFLNRPIYQYDDGSYIIDSGFRSSNKEDIYDMLREEDRVYICHEMSKGIKNKYHTSLYDHRCRQIREEIATKRIRAGKLSY